MLPALPGRMSGQGHGQGQSVRLRAFCPLSHLPRTGFWRILLPSQSFLRGLTMNKDIKKVVLASSGGLDTSVILKWLIET